MNKSVSIELQYASPALQKQVAGISSQKELGLWASACFRKPARITIRFINKAEAHDLNLFFRGFDKPTNVLTFPYHGKGESVDADIVLCLPIVREEAKEQSKTLKAHLAHLLIHGCLHAQGHDHMNTSQAKKMESLEIKLLKSLGFSNPYQ